MFVSSKLNLGERASIEESFPIFPSRLRICNTTDCLTIRDARLGSDFSLFWMFDCNEYEAEIVKKGMSFITLQPHVADHAYIHHMKAMHVPFNWLYGSMICNQGLQGDRPKY